MKPVSAESVQRTWEELVRMNPARATRLVQTFNREQPAVLAFLVAAGSETLDQDAKEELVFLGTAVWQMLKKGRSKLPTPGPDDLLEAYDRNQKLFLSAAEGGPDASTTALLKAHLDHPQPAILQFIISALFEDSEGEFDDETVANLYLCLKSVLDALSEA